MTAQPLDRTRTLNRTRTYSGLPFHTRVVSGILPWEKDPPAGFITREPGPFIPVAQLYPRSTPLEGWCVDV